ncbi:probable mitochondrial adenine nucleotide transporter BTL3 [Ricinus communis]|uniref:Protein brittle-1, chloroplast, putative n=1 Tax=Ricinus communis TaxID=3988 RepID=B9SZ46_RICCO|nr:probable mitochondrial adenine nucleotide transporter BTL3 [Ricinus communis]XP_015582148.1 probable mitochondrial adenine nucleotide transporter BTL3 [Ricinus communis]EEF31129.1 Protein brittle-1, chloroplast precursor, putative [Ricinus communis]|eukprot:XP_002531265.1 probable mitochondrial adenine nucleotide transporter BTL3 [Ricinus communis]
MYGHDLFFFSSLINATSPDDHPKLLGGLFLDHETIPFPSLITKIHFSSCFPKKTLLRFDNRAHVKKALFLSVSLSIKEEEEEEGQGYVGEQNAAEKVKVGRSGSAALNTTKHLWAGAFATMVSRTFIAPLERLKLEYVLRGEQKNLFELIKTIGAAEGLKGFWKGNFVNILRTAPFKSINFYAYDTYRNQLLKLSGNEESTNFERFLAGAAAGITATLLCLPMDTIRTKMIAPGGEVFGGVIATFRHMIQTEGFFSLYKGLIPSVVSMAPSGAVFYGVYDILKSAYLHSPEGKKRIQNLKQEGQELNALEQLELGPIRTLLYGAIAGCCSEAATYPFEVVRRHLQMQVRATKMNALATGVKIVEQGGIPALYAGLVPSLLQVLPSAAISYFVYELMKIVLEVEST